MHVSLGISRTLSACAVALVLPACGGRLLAEDGATDASASLPTSSCAERNCAFPSSGSDASIGASPVPAEDASTGMAPPVVVDAGTLPALPDATLSDDSGTSGSDAGILANCTGHGNVLYFEVGPGQGPLSPEIQTETLQGWCGPGGLSSGSFVNFLNGTAVTADGIYVATPSDLTPGSSLNVLWEVFVQLSVQQNVCKPTTGWANVLELNLPVDAGMVDEPCTGAFVMTFDFSASNCQQLGEPVVATSQEIRGCVSYHQ